MSAGMILSRQTEILGEKLHTASAVDKRLSMELLWNDTDKGN
jgi:hypothetical protein